MDPFRPKPLSNVPGGNDPPMMGTGSPTDKAVVMIELPARLGRNRYLEAGEGGALAPSRGTAAASCSSGL